MLCLKSPHDVENADLPPGPRRAARDSLARLLETALDSGNPYKSERDGFVIVLADTGLDPELDRLLAAPFLDTPLESVALENDNASFVAVVLHGTQCLVVVVPDTPALDPRVREKLLSELTEKEEDVTIYKPFEKHFSEDGFWRKLSLLPRDFGRESALKALLLYVLMTDRETPLWIRMLILGVLGYLVCPIDAIPDLLPIVGYADDIAAMTLLLSRLKKYVTPAIEERAESLLPERFRA